MASGTQAEPQPPPRMKEPPAELDGGYGWWVVLGAWLTFFWVFGLFYSFGVLFSSFLDEFGESRGTTSLLQGVAMATMNSTGWLGGALVDRFGNRNVCACAAVICSGSILVASFCTSIVPMLLSYSVAAGFGNMLAFIAASSLVPAWFSTRRSYAQGIAFTGSGISNAILPPILQAMITAWGWRWALRACAASILCFLLTAAALFKPPPAAVASGGAGGGAATPKKFVVCDGQLVRDPVMLSTLLCIAVAALGFFAPFAHIVKYAGEEAGGSLTQAQGSILLLVMGISNTISRPVSGKIADRHGALHTFAVSAITGGLATCALPFLKGMPALCGYAVVYGFFGGGFVALFMPLNVELFGVPRIARASGLTQMGFGIGATFSAPTAGWMYDAQQDYKPAFLLTGGLFLLGGVLLEVLPKRYLTHPRHLEAIGSKPTAATVTTAGDGNKGDQP